jgi:integrase
VVLNKRDGQYHYLWWENGKRRSKAIGSVRDYKSKLAACMAAKAIVDGLKVQQTQKHVPTVSELVARYRTDEEGMPDRATTKRGYEAWLQNHIPPKWGALPITEVRAYAVRKWLRSLKGLSPKSKVNIRGILHVLWDFAMLIEEVGAQENPMKLVKVTGAKKPSPKKARSITETEFHQLLEALGDDLLMWTLVLVSLSFGLRISEALGLKWSDVNWLEKTITIERGIVKQIVADTKTAESAQTMVIDDQLLEVLKTWKQASQFSAADDWMFASVYKLGREPISYTFVWETLDAAAKRAGIAHISSHTFRHTFRSWLDSAGTPVGVQQKMMRHADIRTTMNVYGDAAIEDRRKAASAVVRKALPVNGLLSDCGGS